MQFKKQPLHTVETQLKFSVKTILEGLETELDAYASGRGRIVERLSQLAGKAHNSINQWRGLEEISYWTSTGLVTRKGTASERAGATHRASHIPSDFDRKSTEAYLRELRAARGQYANLDASIESLIGSDIQVELPAIDARPLLDFNSTQLAAKQLDERDPVVGRARSLIVNNRIQDGDLTNLRWGALEFSIPVRAVSVRLVIYEAGNAGALVGLSRLDLYAGETRLAPIEVWASSNAGAPYVESNILLNTKNHYVNLANSGEGWFSGVAPTSAAPQVLMLTLSEVQTLTEIRFAHSDAAANNKRQPKIFEVQYTSSTEAKGSDPVDSERWITVDLNNGRHHPYLPSESGRLASKNAEGQVVEDANAIKRLAGDASYANQSLYRLIALSSPLRLDGSRKALLAFKFSWDDAVSSDNVFNAGIRMFCELNGASAQSVDWTDLRLKTQEAQKAWQFIEVPLSWLNLGAENVVRFYAQDPASGYREWLNFDDVRLDLPVTDSELRLDYLLSADLDNQIPASPSGIAALGEATLAMGSALKRANGIILADDATYFGSIDLHPLWEGAKQDVVIGTGDVIRLAEVSPGRYEQEGVYESYPLTIPSALRSSFTRYILQVPDGVDIYVRGGFTDRSTLSAPWTLVAGVSGDFPTTDMPWIQVRLVLKGLDAVVKTTAHQASGSTEFFKGTYSDLELSLWDDTISVREKGVVSNYDFFGRTVKTKPLSKATPNMTSNTTPSGIASASSNWTGWNPWKAFNGVKTSDEGWHAGEGVYNTYPHWLAYEFPTEKLICEYRITARQDPPSTTVSDFTLEGWTGSFWMELDRRKGETNWKGGNETRAYTVANPGFYRKYRLHITQGYSLAELELIEGEVIGFGAPSPMNLSGWTIMQASGAGISSTWVPASGTSKTGKEDLSVRQGDIANPAVSVLRSAVFTYLTPVELTIKGKNFSISVPGRGEIRMRQASDDVILAVEPIPVSDAFEVVTFDVGAHYGKDVYFEIAALNSDA